MTGTLSRLIAWRRPLTLAVAVLAGVLAAWLGSGSLDEWLRAARTGFRTHPASGQVVIVEIDEKSISALQHWPWPRGIHAQAVDRLYAARARVIAFDVDFSSPSVASQDALFAAALERAGRGVILPTFNQQESSASEVYLEAQPVPMLARNAFLAAANVRPDPDGRLRRMPYGLFILGAPRPSLASLVAEHPADAGDSFVIDTAIDPYSIPHYSMIDLIGGRVPASAIAGKRIIVGATAVETADRYSIPRHGILPGVIVQAMAAETLLAAPLPVERGSFWALAIALLAVAAAARSSATRTRVLAFAGGTIAVLALLVLGEPLLGSTFALAPALAALAAAALVAAGTEAVARYRERGFTDVETGLPNLAALEADAARIGDCTVAATRIDGFAALASALGSAPAADLVVRLAARLRFAASLGRVYRLDDSSLAWLEPAGVDVAERFDAIAALTRAPLVADRTADIQLHFGAASGAGSSVRQLAANAALAAVQAAEKGERWQVFTRRDSEQVRWSVSLLAEFDSAIADGRIWNAYQPKLDLATGRISGAEALVRWEHPERGPLAPDSFVPQLEQHGRAADLTLAVLRNALEDAKTWMRAGLSFQVAVNVSATLLHDHFSTLRLQETVRASGVPADRIIIEITESAAMAKPEVAIAVLESWRRLGMGVSIDDYGTGQSSLSYLQKLPATELKIDRSFVATIATEPRNAIMVRSTIRMAHELGLKVVAEGVEDEACLAALREMGCDLAQGYLIARPMPAGALTSMIEADAVREMRA
jgi:EAL domain-containing protein (putative c-di-GMP-specific phosphodiesterase class I)/CHASE2 domain-containing sensor protein